MSVINDTRGAEISNLVELVRNDFMRRTNHNTLPWKEYEVMWRIFLPDYSRNTGASPPSLYDNLGALFKNSIGERVTATWTRSLLRFVSVPTKSVLLTFSRIPIFSSSPEDEPSTLFETSRPYLISDLVLLRTKGHFAHMLLTCKPTPCKASNLTYLFDLLGLAWRPMTIINPKANVQSIH